MSDSRLTRRRGNGEGSEPKLRKDGRWQAAYSRRDGRRGVVTVPKGSTKTQCRDALRAAIRGVEDEPHSPTDNRLTVGRWLDTWLKTYVAGGTRPKHAGTVASYTSVVQTT